MSDETDFERTRRLERLDREHRQAMYGRPRHPENAAWAASRDISGGRSLRSWAQQLEARLAAAEAALAKRHRDAEMDRRRADEAHEAEPLIIRRRGGRHHAK